MLRLTELAAVSVVRPTILLLDEPASGIAQAETEALGPLLRRLADRLDATIVLIEHDMPLVMGISDTIIAMAEGSVVTSGTPDHVRAHPEVLASYLGTTAT
jgi:ABC-type branched-subunit amino acid transport system ATPase component